MISSLPFEISQSMQVSGNTPPQFMQYLPQSILAFQRPNPIQLSSGSAVVLMQSQRRPQSKKVFVPLPWGCIKETQLALAITSPTPIYIIKIKFKLNKQYLNKGAILTWEGAGSPALHLNQVRRRRWRWQLNVMCHGKPQVARQGCSDLHLQNYRCMSKPPTVA